jgi:hypothetical protein
MAPPGINVQLTVPPRSSIESNLSSDSQNSKDSNHDIVHDINLEHYSSGIFFCQKMKV